MTFPTFFRRWRKLLLISGACLALALVAGSVFLRPTLATFAMLPNTTDCHTTLPVKVPGRELIVSPQGCKNFSMRVVSQPYPTRLKVCPQVTAGPVLLQLIGNPYQENDCFFWTAKTGEWHSFYQYAQVTDTVYGGFLVIFTGPEDHTDYNVKVEIQQ